MSKSQTQDHRSAKLKVLTGCVLSLAIAILAFGVMKGMIEFGRPEPVETDAAPSSVVMIRGATMGSRYLLNYLDPAATSKGHKFAGNEPQGIEEDKHGQTLDAKSVRDEVEKVLAQVEQDISTWSEQSAISHFNQSKSTEWQDMPLRVVELIARVSSLTPKSDGRFDITVGQLTRLWGFAGGSSKLDKYPEQVAIDAARNHVGMSKLELRMEPPALRKSDPDLEIDLSSAGAGWAVDLVAARLKELGIHNFFLDITGEIAVSGKRAAGHSWSVGVQDPRESANIFAIFEADNCMIATSGNYRNRYTVDGQEVVHTLDATTGKPLQTDLLSVTVVHEKCEQADAIATLLLTCDAAQALAIANAEQWATLLIVQRDNRRPEILTSRKFDEVVRLISPAKSSSAGSREPNRRPRSKPLR